MEPLRSVGSIEVVAMLKESHDGGVKVSLRSSRDIDVQRIARRFGGGGHACAAAFSRDGRIEDIEEEVIRAVAERIVSVSAQ